MPPRCVPCLTPDLRETILQELADPVLRETVAQIPSCGRKRSAYQEFVSQCVKAQNIHGFGAAGPALKKCAADWRAQKQKEHTTEGQVFIESRAALSAPQR